MKNEQTVWTRVKQFQAQPFDTVSGLKFDYVIDGMGIWIFRDGRLINRTLPWSQFVKAMERCPLQDTREIQDLQGPSYIFSILMDSRIRQGLW
jgi:hypothetical protein